jgi:Skp family chaperone for outer membrane proteins
MRKLSLVILVALALPAAVFAQAPAAGGAGGRVAVVDFQKAVTENGDGKKAQERFMAEFNKRQSEFEGKQKSMADMQNKLQTGDKALSESAKADLAKQIDKLTVDLQRMNDDAQKDLSDMQQQLFRPIAEKAQEAIKSYSTENGFAVVFDTSSQASSIIYFQDVADITTEIIRRMDATAAKPSATPAATPKPPADPTTKKE